MSKWSPASGVERRLVVTCTGGGSHPTRRLAWLTYYPAKSDLRSDWWSQRPRQDPTLASASGVSMIDSEIGRFYRFYCRVCAQPFVVSRTETDTRAAEALSGGVSAAWDVSNG